MAHPKGFTLIELLLYISVSGMVLLALSGFFFMLLQARIKGESIAEVDEQGAAVMEMITQEVRNSSAISLPVVGQSGDSLVLSPDDPAKSPETFSLSGSTIQVAEGTDDPLPLTNTKVAATNFHVENLSALGTPGSVRISFTLARVNVSGRNEYDYVKTFEVSASRRQP